MPSSTTYSLWRSRLILTTAFAMVCTLMHHIAATNSLITGTGPAIALYNTLSIPFLFLFGTSCYCLGSLVVPVQGLHARMDWVLLRSIVGYSLFNLLGYGIGLAQILHHPIALVTLALPLLFFPKDSCDIPCIALRHRAKVFFLAALTLFILCFSGALYVYIENDFGMYFPTFDVSLYRGDLLPNVYFWIHFYTKGCGAAYLAMAATSPFVVHINTLYTFLITGLLIYRMSLMVSGNELFAFATALLIIASKVIKAEAYRLHSVYSMLLLAVPYIMAKLYFGPEFLRPRLRIILALVMCTAIVAQPSTAAFLFLPLLYFLAAPFLGVRMASFRTSVVIAAAPTLTFFALLLFNYIISGIPEMTPAHAMMKIFNYESISLWASPHTIKISLLESMQYTGFSFKLSSLNKPSLKLAAYSLPALVLFFTLRKSRKIFSIRLLGVMLPLLALGIQCPFIEAICNQTSLSRYTIFFSAMQPLYFTTFLLVFLSVSLPWIRCRWPRVWPTRKIITVIFSAAAAYALFFNWTPKVAYQKLHTQYFFGHNTLAPLLGHWHEPEIDTLNTTTPSEMLIFPLYFSPYSHFLNSRKFVRCIENTHIRQLPVMIGPNTDAAAAAYAKEGIKLFVVDFAPKARMVYQCYSPLFEPPALERYFRVRHLGHERWLLTLWGTDTDGAIPDADFLCQYANKLNSELVRPDNYFFSVLSKLRESDPDFALPYAMVPQHYTYCGTK